MAGAALSGAIAPPQLILASTTAFLLSELADFAVYTPLQSRGLVLAVLASSVVGLIADSILFLWLAFGSLDFLAGQIVGKLWMVVAFAAVHSLDPQARDRPASRHDLGRIVRRPKVSACMRATGPS